MSNIEFTSAGYAVYSRVAGVIATFRDFPSALDKARAENAGCVAQGGYGDRDVFEIDSEGLLRRPSGQYVYPSGDKSRGAVRVTLPIPA